MDITFYYSSSGGLTGFPSIYPIEDKYVKIAPNANTPALPQERHFGYILADGYLELVLDLWELLLHRSERGPPTWEEARALCSQFASVREHAITTGLFETQRQVEEGGGCVPWRLGAQRSRRQAP
jgi:hypothetical protein